MQERLDVLWRLGETSIKELETDRGILASGKSELYGCIFGRDSLITALSLLRLSSARDLHNLSLVKKILENLTQLQGTEVRIESGEEPGKCIHEFRPSDHERLTARTEIFADKPNENAWYVYPDNVMRNYDTVDATPLLALTMHHYLRVSNDYDFISEKEVSVRAALTWILDYGDTNNDGLIDYRFHPERVHGGLATQSWMDSAESVFFEEHAHNPRYPIAPVEVQAYAFVALRAWSDYFKDTDALFSAQLKERAQRLKRAFNERFVSKSGSKVQLHFAVDGNGAPLSSPRSSMGHVLWAVYHHKDGSLESVLDPEYMPAVAERLMARDLFVPKAGVRTLSSRSKRFDPYSYHNGSIWPHDTAILAEGLENFGFVTDAERVRKALLQVYTHFNTPIELFVYEKGRFKEYRSPEGQAACRTQAWSAASLLRTIDALQSTESKSEQHLTAIVPL